MKKLVSSVLVGLSMTLLVSCGGSNITESNAVEKYTEFVDSYNTATETKTTTNINIITETDGQSETTDYDVIYSEVNLGDDNYQASANLASTDEATPLVMDLYYKDGALYGSRSDDETSKLKFTVDYPSFKSAYNSFNPLVITEDTIISKEFTQTDDNTVMTLVLNKDSYSDLFQTEMANIETMTMIPQDLLEPIFSDINYVVTFDDKGDVNKIESNYNINMTISLASILGLEGEEAAAIPDQSIDRNITTTTTIDSTSNVTIEFPTDLDSYVEQQ